MKYDNFFGDNEDHKYHVSSYFYCIEFQARGAPHVHSLLWLKDASNSDAPSFWNEEFILPDQMNNDLIEKQRRIERFADAIISTSANDMVCEKHEINFPQIIFSIGSYWWRVFRFFKFSKLCKNVA